MLEEYHIKSIVDLQMPGTDDLTLNPENWKIQAEKRMLSQKLMGLIILVTHPSKFKQRKHKNFYKNNG
jgi:hypothetical protein